MPGRLHAPAEGGNLVRRAAALFASLDLTQTAAACAAFVAQQLGARTARVYLLRGSAVSLAAGNGVTLRERARVPRAMASRVRRAAERQGPSVDGEDPATLLLPVRAGQRAIGVLALEMPDGTRVGRDSACTVAQLAGVALANALTHQAARRRAERLAELERTKSQFLNLASHELRGPLTVLMGYLSLLEDGAFGEVPSELAATLPAINARVTEMESLINAMLDTARLEDDRLELSFSEEDLREIAAEAVERFRPFLHPGQRLRLSAPAERVAVNVDRARAGMALGNLISNAIKYSTEHTDVDCAVEARGDEAVFAVTDRGIGIAPAQLPALFTRFGRVRTDPAVRAISGTGLGLFLARELVRAHGGDITVLSEPGCGSTFTLSLPAAR